MRADGCLNDLNVNMQRHLSRKISVSEGRDPIPMLLTLRRSVAFAMRLRWSNVDSMIREK